MIESNTISPSVFVGAATHVGRVRDHNEDALCVPPALTTYDVANKGMLLVVCDGVGGLQAGEVASATAAQAAFDAYYAYVSDDRSEALQHAVQVAHEAVQKAQAQIGANMASTIVMAVIHDGHVHVANVGDSRCYLLHEGQLTQLSTDHSWIGAQVRAGVLTTEEAKLSAYQNVLTRSLGLKAARVEADVAQADWVAGDKLLLCSDGVWNMVPDAELAQILMSAGASAQQAADALVQAANAGGGADNITAVVAIDPSQPTVLIRRHRPAWVLPIAIGGLAVAGLFIAGVLVQAIQRSADARAQAAAFTPQVVFTSATPLPTATPATSTVILASITRTATPVAAAMSNTSPQATATVRARLIQFCRESVLAKGECRKSESSFNRRLARAKDVDVFGVWHLDDLSGANSITMQWTVNGTPHPPAVCTLSGNQCKEANVSPVKSNIPTTEPGDYRLDVIADGQPVLTGSFKVD